MPQRDSLLPYRGVLSFLSKAREASGSEAARVHHAARRRGGAWPVAGMRSSGAGAAIGVLMNLAADDPAGQARLPLSQGLQELGWTRPATCGSTTAGPQAMPTHRKYATELVALAPDVILAAGGPAWRRAAGDQHGADRVRVRPRSGRGRLRRQPGAAGRQCHRFHNLRIRHQWEMARTVKEIAPRVTRVAVLRDPAIGSGTGQLGAIQSVAPSRGGAEPGQLARRVRDRARPSRHSRDPRMAV